MHPSWCLTGFGYLSICSKCLHNEEALAQFLSLLRNDLVIPVLLNEYSLYPDRLIEQLRTKDHISCVREYQPRITGIVDEVIQGTGDKGTGFDAVSREISHLNNAIERIKKFKTQACFRGYSRAPPDE